jgi:hypothetical protein
MYTLWITEQIKNKDTTNVKHEINHNNAYR